MVVKYTGWLYDESTPDHHGTRIDSSADHGQLIGFTLGEGKVIAGWDKRIQGLRGDGERTLLIPSRLAYGGRRVGKPVSPHASPVFEIQQIAVH